MDDKVFVVKNSSGEITKREYLDARMIKPDVVNQADFNYIKSKYEKELNELKNRVRRNRWISRSNCFQKPNKY